MNSIKCPQCGLVNWGRPAACKRCGASFEDVDARAFVSVPAGENAYTPGRFTSPTETGPQETEQTRKAWKWFRIYCVLMVFVYLFVAVLGITLLFLSATSSSRDAASLQAQGVIFLLMGMGLTIPYALGPFLKSKTWGWVYGIALIALGLTSCCLWPITIPLMIQWVKPEMKRMFGSS